MQEIKFRFITLTSISSIILALPASATQSTSDHTSEQLRSYFMDARSVGDGGIITTFSADGTRGVEQIGAKRIIVFNKVGGVQSIVESWSKGDSGMTISDAYYYGSTIYFNSKAGMEYCVDITIFAESSSGSDSRAQTFFVTTQKAKAGTPRPGRAPL